MIITNMLEVRMKKFIDINAYMTQSRDSRRSHLNLDEECIEIGGDSRLFRGLLAHFLGTTIGNHKIYVCHACYNEKCSNPKHLYWGTPSDNVKDTKESGRWKSPHQSMIEKYGLDEVRKRQKEYGSLGGKAGGGHNALDEDDILEWKKSIDQIDTRHFGWIAKLSKQMNCSHTHVRRIVTKHFPELETYKRK